MQKKSNRTSRKKETPYDASKGGAVLLKDKLKYML